MKDQIFLYDLEKSEGEKHLVKGVNYQPYAYPPTIEGIYLNKEDFPVLEESKLKTNDVKLYYNQATNKAYYEYFERPISEESEIEILKKQVAELSFLVMQLQGGTN